MRFSLILLMVLSFSYSFSQTKTWDEGAGTKSYGDAANWNPDGVPGLEDEIQIPYGDTVEIQSGTYSIKYIELRANSLFTIHEGAQLNVENSTNRAFDASGSTSKVINKGTLEINNSGFYALLIYGSFKNDSTGILTITNSGSYGIITGTNDTLNNYGQITITSPGDHGIYNTGTVNNFASGVINIESGSSYGFRNGGDDFFNNYGTLNVDEIANYAVENSGKMTNYPGAVMTISNGYEIGLNNRNSFINHSGATVNIHSTGDGFGDYGLNNDLNDSLFNYGIINIVNAADDGIYNNGYIMNDSTGEISIDTVGVHHPGYGIQNLNGRTFLNYGLTSITASSETSLYNLGTFHNGAVASLEIFEAANSGILIGSGDLVDNFGSILIQGSVDKAIYSYGTLLLRTGCQITVQN